MLTNKDYIKEELKKECYLRKINVEIDDELLDLILCVVQDTELYDMILRLDFEY